MSSSSIEECVAANKRMKDMPVPGEENKRMKTEEYYRIFCCYGVLYLEANFEQAVKLAKESRSFLVDFIENFHQLLVRRLDNNQLSENVKLNAKFISFNPLQQDRFIGNEISFYYSPMMKIFTDVLYPAPPNTRNDIQSNVDYKLLFWVGGSPSLLWFKLFEAAYLPALV